MNYIENIRIMQIIPNKNQPRKNFDQEGLRALSESIKSVGLIQPIVVRKMTNEMYELIAGERRLKACKLAGFERIQAIVINASEKASAEMALVENIQRKDLNFFEEAIAYSSILDSFNITQSELAERIGKSQSSIANKLRLLKFNPNVRNAIIVTNLSERHARALLKIEDDELLLRIIEQIVNKKLNVASTERLVDRTLEQLNNKETKEQLFKNSKINYRLYVNTIKNAYNQLLDTGIDAEFKQEDLGDYIELKVIIPKK